MIKEVYLTLFYIISVMSLSALNAADNNILTEIIYYLRSSLVIIQGLLPIYFSLYYIKKCEGTLDVNIWSKRHEMQIYRMSSPSLHSKQSVSQSDIQTIPAENDKLDGVSKEEVLKNLELPCLVFLKNKNNYTVFAEYLAHCFAIENLAFLERVSVFYQIVRKLKKKEKKETQKLGQVPSSRVLKSGQDMDRSYDDNYDMKIKPELKVDDESNQHIDRRKIVQRVKFEYLRNIYLEYNGKIDEWSNRSKQEYKKGSFDYYKVAIYDLCKEIYDEYISQSALQQVNLSYEVRSSLTFLFQDVDKVNIDKFVTFDDYMTVFDGALVEIYLLLLSLYSYKFKSYCRTLQD